MLQDILTKKIRELANVIGIDALGFADASSFTNYALIDSIRRDPKQSLPNAKTIIVAGIYIGGLTLPFWTNSLYARTSRLFLSGYFLDAVKPLEPIISFLRKKGYCALICDSSKSESSVLPLKLAAIRAGLGWQGRNSLLVSKKYGTFLALGGIITDAVLDYNTKEEPNRCKNCSKCLEACPMSAFEQPYVLNRRKCLSSQLTNEQISKDAQLVMENRIFDCEICQDVCPWNKKHIVKPLTTKLTLSFLKEIKKWKKYFYLPSLVDLTEEGYKKIFDPLKTDITYDVFHRNVLMVSANIKSSRQLNNIG